MNEDHIKFIEAVKDMYKCHEYNEMDNTLEFHEIFDGVVDPAYISYVTIEDGYVVVEYIVGPKQQYHDYTELNWANTEFELNEWIAKKGNNVN